ncbi:MAG: hypothetical protein NPIRA02_04880 [Nitrospirales bacterium]|nr:MAG: hypothetical protein NPIRA02_04880 [Nitrospirales bacterium]
MNNKRKAAIDIDKVMDSPLRELNAAEFVEVLNHPKVKGKHSWIITDKKKYELWIEETEIVNITVGELIEKLRGEKKKVELEPFIDIGHRVFPGELIRESDVQFSRLVEDVARRVEERLGKK